MAVKTWCGTLNNYTAEEYEGLISRDDYSYAVIGKEKGENSTPHLQMTLTFKVPKRLAAMKKICPRAHWEVTKALEESRTYCKKDGDYVEIGKPTPGKRTDIESACELALCSMERVAREMPEMIVKYHKGLERYRCLMSKQKEFKQLEVIVLWGEAGKGKTKRAYEIDPDLYSVREPNNGSLWFCGYDGQDTILFDDFYGWIKYSYLLKLLDGYPMILDTKGGTVNKQWSRVIFTSNDPVEKWYHRSELSALMRRITDVRHITDVTDTEVAG